MTDDYRDSERTTVVSDVRIMRMDVNRTQNLNCSEHPDWRVEVDTKTGMFPVAHRALFRDFSSKEAAENFAARFTVGSEIGDQREFDQAYPFGGPYSREQFEEHFELGLLERPWRVIAGRDQLASDILREAGVTNSASDTTEAVAETLGKDRLERLQSRYGEKWASAAAFEYCWYNLPHSSPAYLAAAYQYHRHITGNDFSAGYLWREIEYVVSGVEATAKKALMMYEKAGEKGKEISSGLRKKRISALMDALESAAANNPGVGKTLGEKDLLKIALADAVQANKKLWSQGKGQAREYLGEIRRGEAGEDLKLRYAKLFPPKTA